KLSNGARGDGTPNDFLPAYPDRNDSADAHYEHDEREKQRVDEVEAE
nr:hypothetical protein [Tanacetum cinerariifolium]